MQPHKQLQFGEDTNLVALRLAWDRALNALSSRVNKPLFEGSIKTIVPLEYEDGRVVLGASSEFARYWIEHKYLSTIQEILGDHLGERVKVSVRILEPDSEEDQDATGQVLAPAGGAQALPRVQKTPDFVLNDAYTFDTFVVGPSNRMAYASACSVAKTPGNSYNPLFIYGGPGLGKTHLLHAIGNFLSIYQPDVTLKYTSAETFTCDYITAVQDKRTHQFRRKYRNIDVLLIDDIQFLASKERTREEFFHTFNALHEVGRQIVLTSDRPPKDLELDIRLSSRFEAGLVVDIAPPELETRMAIIKSKAEKQDMAIPNEVALYIARLIRSNIRAIEGALLKLHAYAAVMNVPVSTDMATDILARYFEQPRENVVTAETINTLVAGHFGVTVDDLMSASREARVVLARQIAMYLIRELTRCSLPAIGKEFGGKDHSTVLHAIKKINKLVLENSQIADDIAALTKELKDG